MMKLSFFEGPQLCFEEIQHILKGCYPRENQDSNPLYVSAGSMANIEDQDSCLGFPGPHLNPLSSLNPPQSIIAKPGCRAFRFLGKG